MNFPKMVILNVFHEYPHDMKLFKNLCFTATRTVAVESSEDSIVVCVALKEHITTSLELRLLAAT